MLAGFFALRLKMTNIKQNKTSSKVWWGLLLISLVYLYLELSFNLSLLKLVSIGKLHVYSNVDHAGRFLSGFGASLIITRLIILSNLKSKRQKLIALLLFIPLAFGGVYQGQEVLINKITSSTPITLKEKVYSGYITQKGIANGSQHYSALDFNMIAQPQVAKDVFFGTFFFHAMGNPALHDKDKIAKFVKPAFTEDFKENTQFYYTNYKRIKNDVGSKIALYRNSSNKVKRRIKSEMNNGWKEVQSGYNRFSNDELSRFGADVRAQIRKKIKQKTGAVLPRNWSPHDKRTFYNVVGNKAFSDANKDFKKAMRKKLGFELPLGLSDSQLMSNRTFRKEVNKNIGIYRVNGSFPMVSSNEGFVDQYKDVIPKNLSADYRAGYAKPDSVDAVFKLSIVPMVAICFSIVFTVLNGFSLVSEVMLKYGFNSKKTKDYHIARLVIFMMLLLTPFNSMHSLLYDPFYHTLKESMTELPVAVTYYYDWLVAVEFTLLDSLGPVLHHYF